MGRKSDAFQGMGRGDACVRNCTKEANDAAAPVARSNKSVYRFSLPLPYKRFDAKGEERKYPDEKKEVETHTKKEKENGSEKG